MPKYGCIIVEGPHDMEFVCRLLHPHGLKRVGQRSELDDFFDGIVPKKFPHRGDLLKRVPVPLFLQSTTHAVAIHTAESDTRIIESVEEDWSRLDASKLAAMGVIFDADYNLSPSDRYASIRDGFRKKGFAMPDSPGNVASGPPRLGGFVMPDNLSAGTLEDILLECAVYVYPSLLATATTHVETASRDNTLEKEDLRELKKPAGKNKAILGSIATILRPGRAIQNSIQDNRWLCDATLTLPRVRAIKAFLSDLLELPDGANAPE